MPALLALAVAAVGLVLFLTAVNFTLAALLDPFGRRRAKGKDADTEEKGTDADNGPLP